MLPPTHSSPEAEVSVAGCSAGVHKVYCAVIQPQGTSQVQPLVDREEEEEGELEEGEEVRSVCWGPPDSGPTSTY